MKPSARSVATGPGSRGGRWHDPEFRRAYQRAWRAEHPEYRERERARRRAVRTAQTETDAQERVGFVDTLLLVIAEDVAARGVQQVAKALGVSHRTVGRWLRRERTISADGVDAAVAAYGIDALAAIHPIVRTDAVEQRLAAGQLANFRGRNQHDRTRALPADTGGNPRPIDWQAVYDGDEPMP